VDSQRFKVDDSTRDKTSGVSARIREVSPLLADLLDHGAGMRISCNDAGLFLLVHCCREVWNRLPELYGAPKARVVPGEHLDVLIENWGPESREEARIASFNGRSSTIPPRVVDAVLAIIAENDGIDANIEAKFRFMCAAIAGVRGTDYVDAALVRRWVKIRPSRLVHVGADSRGPSRDGAYRAWDEMIDVLHALYQPQYLAYENIDRLLGESP
jgi:hypothetical protein